MAQYFDYTGLTNDPLLLYGLAKFSGMPDYKADQYLQAFSEKAEEVAAILTLYCDDQFKENEEDTRRDGSGGRGVGESTEPAPETEDQREPGTSPGQQENGDLEIRRLCDQLQLGSDDA